MKRCVILATINAEYTRFSLSIEFLAAKILSDSDLCRKIRLIKKIYRPQTSREKILQQILPHSPHLIGFSCYVWNMAQIFELSAAIKANLPNTLIVLGGPEVAGLGSEILEKHPCIDGVVMGEGEETFAQMLSGWLQSDTLDPLPGTVVRQGERILAGSYCPPIKDLDRIPSPYDYLKQSILKPSNVISFQSLRGCNRKCFYCYFGKSFPNVRYFSLDRVNEDLEKIRRIGVNRVDLIDPSFLCHYDHAVEVIRILTEKKLRFRLEVNAEDLDEKTIDLLAHSTCCEINFGFQSSNPTALKLCGRPSNLELLAYNVRRLAEKAPNIALHLDLILGLPGDTLENFLNSIDFAFSFPMESVYIFTLQALPGTPFYKQPEKWGIEFDVDPPHLVYKTNTFSAEGIKQARMIQSAYMDLYFPSCTIQSIMQFIYNRISQTHSHFLNRLVLWDEKHEQRFIEHYPGKTINLPGIRYLLSAVSHIYPDTFSAQELEYILEWYRFKQYLHRLEKKRFQNVSNLDLSGEEEIFWQRSHNIAMGRFRIKPRLNLDTLVPEPLAKKKRRLVLQKNSQGTIHIYEISGEMEKLLKFFRKAKALNSYLSASDTSGETVVDRHIRIQYARKQGFIQPLSA